MTSPFRGIAAWRRAILPLIGLFLVVLGGSWARLQPAHARDWRPEQAVLPRVVIEDGLVHVANVRNFSYRSASDFTPRYEDRTYELDKLERVWFVLSPFSRAWRGPAHTFLSFSFADSQFVSISVEARREVGEDYSILRGALRQFELMFVIGDESDLIGLRAVAWDDPVYLYPVRATPEQARELFLKMLDRAQQIERAPEFYSTLTSNCTTNILDAVNAIAGRRIRFGVEALLPGYSDRPAHRLDLLDTDLPLDQARARYCVNERARAAFGAADFSLRIRD